MTLVERIWWICNVVVILYVWFDTDAFIEWARLLRIPGLKIKEYDTVRLSMMRDLTKTYNDFLLLNYNKVFFVRLVTCPICLTVWLNLFVFGFTTQLSNWSPIGFHIFSSWILYHMLKWVIHFRHE